MISQAIPSVLSPSVPGFGVKPGGAADGFAISAGAPAFGDVLVGASRQGGARGSAGQAEPSGRAERAGGEADRGERDEARGKVDGDAADDSQRAAGASRAEGEATEGKGVGQDQADESDAGDAEQLAAADGRAEDTGGADDSASDAVAQGEATAGAGSDADEATAAAASALEAALAGSNPAGASAAAESGAAGQAHRAERPQLQSSIKPGESQAMKQGVSTLGAGEALAQAAPETANPVTAAGAATYATTSDADATPLILQPAASTGAAAADSSAASPQTTAPAAAPAVADSAPGPIPIQGGQPTAGAQLAEAHAARADENAALNNARLARGLASAVNQKGGAITLRLTPPEMGTVRIQMQLTGTTLAASFHAETASAHALLTQQLGQLRASLETQGLHVERLSVQPMQPTQQGNNAASQDDAQQQPHQQPNDGRSRGQSDRQPGSQRDATRDDTGRDDGTNRRPISFDDHLETTTVAP